MGVDVSILIVTYQCRDEVLECLASLTRATRECRYEVIVVDNASDDGTPVAIAEAYPTTKIIVSSENLGFARAVNRAADAAEGEYLLLLNPDTVVLDGTIEELLRFARAHPQFTAYGGRTLDPAGNLDPRSAWGAPTLWSLTAFGLGLSWIGKGRRWFDPESIPGWRRDTVRVVDVVTGCLLLMRRTDWDRFGGLDPIYFVYGEDADLGMRISAAGKASVIDPDAVIVHRVGASSNQRSDKMRLVMQGRATLLRRRWDGWRRRAGLGALQLGVGVRAAGFGMRGAIGRGRPDDGAVWRDVWQDRTNWRQGFPATPETDAFIGGPTLPRAVR